ncbi:MAG: hypothetical protein ACM3UY_08000 [Methanocella sp.]|jgi:hypothetical protein
MPFCRKCGRRLVEYSEVCTDCGTSTTAPIINTKRIVSGRLYPTGGNKKIARAIIPEVSPVTIKVIVDSPAKAFVPAKAPVTQKAAAAPSSRIDVLKAAAAPFKVATPPKPAEQPKPALSSKHIVKPKKAAPTKPAARFTLANARPIAGLEAAQTVLSTAPKPLYHPKPVVSAPPAVQPKPIHTPPPAPVISIAKPAPAPSTQQAISPPPVATQIKPVITLPQPAAPAKPITPAPEYPPHEIIQSNVSLKQDILAHPEDYETQSFDFDLVCRNRHFWPEGSSLPVSNGVAYCLKCGERLRKPKPKKRRRFHRY